MKNIPSLDQIGKRTKVQRFDFSLDLNRLMNQVVWKKPSDARPELAIQVKKYLIDGVPSHVITNFITSFVDEALHRFIELGIESTGIPKSGWMFMLMGSEGRQEQTLLTDQDSALVLSEGMDASAMQLFGSFVSDKLHQLGISYCKGNVMASNPKWVLSSEAWKRTFRRWVNEPEPMAIMQACIFFDLRAAYGDIELEKDLVDYISALLKGRSGLFFYHMAHNALKHNPPLGFFGGLKRSAKTELDIKKAVLPITDHARIYSLKYGVTHRNTLKRIETLKELNQYSGANADEIKLIYEFLTQIRLWNQLNLILDGKPASNSINPSLFEPHIQKEIIYCLQKTRDLQQNIALHFRGNY